ncbi:MAG: nitroreductase family protein [Spirochaetales bacterium]|nr:nitroreductase family protein [Spirochaetales bacterium]
MEWDDVLKTRRAFRSLKKTEITEQKINALCNAVRLTPSCFNNQPWRFLFAYEPGALSGAIESLSEANKVWAKDASLIIAVMSERELDCKMKDGRDYYKFDTGMAAAVLILKATAMGLVAHPIAGYDPVKVKEFFKIPEPLEVLALIVVGEKAETANPALKDYQVKDEKTRPERKEIGDFVYLNRMS